MTDQRQPTPEEVWRGLLLGTDRRLASKARLFKHIPGGSTRCKMCRAPFGFPGGLLMRRIQRGQWAKNPRYCEFCSKALEAFRGGAEIPASFLFADIRGSTTLAEQMSATEFHRLLNRFYELASGILVAHDGVVDKFVGDEVVALFIPALAGDNHAARAVAAGQELLEGMRATADRPEIPVGIGVHSGVAYIGSVGEPPITDFTALGDAVNVTARLASAAGAGELLISREAAAAAGLRTDALESRSLELKGKSAPVEVVVLGRREGKPVA